METHSSIHAWKILWTQEPGQRQSMGSQSNMTEQLNTQIHVLIQKGKQAILPM